MRRNNLSHCLVAFALSACATTPEGDMPEVECESQAVETLPTGNHNEGKNCISGGCHDGGTASAPQWTVAGTLYRDPGGSATLAGGKFDLVDAAGVEVSLVSAQNGNFWTNQTVTFPLFAKATACLEIREMPNPVPLGSCNQSGCHASSRIDLP
jgi:hypothetical protein